MLLHFVLELFHNFGHRYFIALGILGSAESSYSSLSALRLPGVGGGGGGKGLLTNVWV